MALQDNERELISLRRVDEVLLKFGAPSTGSSEAFFRQSEPGVLLTYFPRMLIEGGFSLLSHVATLKAWLFVRKSVDPARSRAFMDKLRQYDNEAAGYALSIGHYSNCGLLICVTDPSTTSRPSGLLLVKEGGIVLASTAGSLEDAEDEV